MNKNQEPDVSTMRRHLELVCGASNITLQFFSKKPEHRARCSWLHVRKLDDQAIQKIVDTNLAGIEVGFVPNPTDGKGRSTSNCTGINWVFADFDDGLEELRAFRCRPHIRVRTSAGKLHAYWRVEGCGTTDFGAVQRLIANRLNGDPSVCDTSRCLRLAGTLNWKGGEPQLVKLKAAHHSFEDIAPIPIATLIGQLERMDQRKEVPKGRSIVDAVSLVVSSLTGRVGYDGQDWWAFDGIRWTKNRNQHFAQMAVRDAVAEVAKETGDMQLAKTAKSAASIRTLLADLALQGALQFDRTKLNRDPDLLAVKNGVVNLRTGEFRRATPKDMLRLMTNVSYEEGADCPRFKAFIREICCGRDDMGRYLCRALGYSITGDTEEHKLFVLRGKAGNGKGTLLHCMAYVLGEYAVQVQPSLLVRAHAGDPNAPSPALMALEGVRMVICNEFQAGRRFDETFIKQITGGDKLVGRGLYGEQTEFQPSAHVWLSTNHDPHISHNDDAMWRRIAMLPCDGDFSRAGVEDKTLRTTLESEASGILNLLIRQARKYWDAGGLPHSATVSDASLDLRHKADTVRVWIDECCVKDHRSSIGASEAHASYRTFTRSIGKSCVSPQAFRKRYVASVMSASVKARGTSIWG